MMLMMMLDDDVDVGGDDILLITGRPTYFSGWRFLQYLATGEKYPIYQNSCVSIVFGHIGFEIIITTHCLYSTVINKIIRLH